MSHTPIHVSRYDEAGAAAHGYELTVTPEDRSWILFVPTGGAPPVVYSRRSRTEEDGTTSHEYGPALAG